MIQRRGAAAALAVLALAVARCAPSAPLLTLPPTPVTPAEAAAALEAAEGAVRTLRGLADVRLERGGQHQRFREAAVLAMPDKLRLETLQFGGATALILVTNGDHLVIYSLVAKEFAQGHVTAAALAELAGVAVEPRHLLRLLAGLPPLPFRAADPRSRLEPYGAEFVAESTAGPFWQRLRLDAGGGVAGGELYTPTGPAFAFHFADQRQLAGRTFPFRLFLDQPGVARVEVSYRNVELNPPVDVAVFSLGVPAEDVRVVDLDAVQPR